MHDAFTAAILILALQTEEAAKAVASLVCQSRPRALKQRSMLRSSILGGSFWRDAVMQTPTSVPATTKGSLRPTIRLTTLLDQIRYVSEGKYAAAFQGL